MIWDKDYGVGEVEKWKESEGTIRMKTMLKLMQNPKNGIPEEKLPRFEEIVQTKKGAECEGEFMKAMAEELTKEQRFLLFGKQGLCQGTAEDPVRKAFALEHKDKPLEERLVLYAKTYGRKATLLDEQTMEVTFACHHGYYKHAPKGKFQFPDSVETYFERCAGGRLYEYEKALGIKLKIKSVDVSPLEENILHPVKFIFEILE